VLISLPEDQLFIYRLV